MRDHLTPNQRQALRALQNVPNWTQYRDVGVTARVALLFNTEASWMTPEAMGRALSGLVERHPETVKRVRRGVYALRWWPVARDRSAQEGNDGDR